jgi:hypothetical protein
VQSIRLNRIDRKVSDRKTSRPLIGLEKTQRRVDHRARQSGEDSDVVDPVSDEASPSTQDRIRLLPTGSRKIWKAIFAILLCSLIGVVCGFIFGLMIS